MLIFIEKIKKSNHIGCPFCREDQNPDYNISHFHGKTKLDLTNDENNNNELKERYSINEEDWLFP